MNGEDLSLPKFDPFWAKAAEMNELVFMHPGGAENIISDSALRGRGDLGNIMGNPLETTYFLSRLIFDGVFDRHPRLKVCGAHAGGYLPSYFGRTEVGVRRARQRELREQEAPEGIPAVADHDRHDDLLGGRSAASRRRDGRAARSSTGPTTRSTGR